MLTGEILRSTLKGKIKNNNKGMNNNFLLFFTKKYKYRKTVIIEGYIALIMWPVSGRVIKSDREIKETKMST